MPSHWVCALVHLELLPPPLVAAEPCTRSCKAPPCNTLVCRQCEPTSGVEGRWAPGCTLRVQLRTAFLLEKEGDPSLACEAHACCSFQRSLLRCAACPRTPF